MSKKRIFMAVAGVAALFLLIFMIFSVESKNPNTSNGMVNIIRDVTAGDLLPAVNAYNKAPESEKPQLLTKAVKLSEERKETMLKLMREDPAAASGIVMTDEQRALLPPEAQKNVEVATTIEDTFKVAVREDPGNDNASLEFSMGGGEGTTQLYFARADNTALRSVASTTQRFRGYKLANQMVVPESGASNIAAANGSPSGSAASVPYSGGGLGTKKLAVFLVTFPNKSSLGFTAADVQSQVFGSGASVKTMFADMSYGQTTITGNVMGPYQINATSPDSNCEWSTQETWLSAAKSAAVNAGADLSGYTNFVVVTPKSSTCKGSGIAQINGTDIFINGSWNNWYTVFVHELGHNIGNWHSSSLSCTKDGARVVFGGSCTSKEYGDTFSVMGDSYSHRAMTSSQRGQSGYLKESNTLTVTGDGTYTLAPAEKASAGVQALRIKLKNTFTVNNSQNGQETYPYYYMEFRQPSGQFDNFASGDPVVNGVSLRLGGDYSARPIHTQLLDAAPTTSTFADAPILAGKSVTLPDGYTITVTGVSAAGATVQISGLGGAPSPTPTPTPAPAPADTTPPSIPTLTLQAESSSSIRANWTAATDNVGVTGYEVYRGDRLLASVGPDVRTYLETGLNAGIGYKYMIKVRDAAGNVSSTPFVRTTTLPLGSPAPEPAGDKTAPSTPAGLSVSSATTTQVNLVWSASTDNVGVSGYDIYRGGTKVGSSGTTSFGDVGLAVGTSYTYSVVAFDAAGNRSANSASLTATTPKATTTATGTLSGYVHTYNNPKPIMGVSVKVYRTDGSLIRSAVTNAQGTFTISGLPADRYTMEVTYEGQNILKRSTTVSANRTTSWDIWVY